jgi:hypothetical protein
VAPEASDETELVPPESSLHCLTKIWRDDLCVIHDHRAAVPTAGRDRARPSRSAKFPYPVLTRRRAERTRSLVARKRRRLRSGTRNGFRPQTARPRLTKFWRDDLCVIHDHRAVVPTAGRDRARPSKSAKLPYPVLTLRRAERARSLVARKRRRIRSGTRNGFRPQTARPRLTKFWRDDLRVIPLLRRSRPYPVRLDPAQAFSMAAITSASISP